MKNKNKKIGLKIIIIINLQKILKIHKLDIKYNYNNIKRIESNNEKIYAFLH